MGTRMRNGEWGRGLPGLVWVGVWGYGKALGVLMNSDELDDLNQNRPASTVRGGGGCC